MLFKEKLPMGFPYKKFSNIRKLGAEEIEDVFLATIQSTSNRVVIKKLASDLGEYQGNYKKFDHNAKTLQSLNHNNIIHVYDYGVYENSYYLSMEYIDGFDLEKLLAIPSFDRNIGLMIVFEALKGLLYAHKHSVFHCDIKPGNILVAKNGRVKLSDFGLAHVKEHLLHAEHSNSVFITPYYMPPEQASAIAEQALDSDVWAETTTLAYKETMQDHVNTIREQTMQWDMWSVGVLLYRVCAGRLPFNGENLAQLANSISTLQAKKVHDLVPSISVELSGLIDACLAKDPAKRLASVDPVIASLQLYFLSIGAHDLDREIRNHLFNFIEPAEERVFHAGPRTPGDESPVFPVLNASNGSPQTKLLKAVGIVTAVLIVFILGALFFTLRPQNRAATDDASLQNRNVPAPVATPDVPVKTLVASAGAPPVQDSFAEDFMAVDSAIAGVASSQNSSGPLRGTTGKKSAAVNIQPPSKPAVSPLARSLSGEPIDSRSSAKSPQNLLGILKVYVEPGNALVSVDGVTISSQEIAMGRQFPAGEHTILASANGYVPYRQTLQMEAGATQIMSIALKQKERGSGFLNIYSYPWSTIFIDGLMLGTTPTPSPIALAEGEHTMRLERDGFIPYIETVMIKNGEVTRIQVDLEKQPFLEDSPVTTDSIEQE